MIRLLLFTAALCGTVILTADWTAVERGVNIPWDLEGTPLQIKTDSTLGSDNQIRVYIMLKSYGYVNVKFSSPIMQYYISYCTSGWTNLPVQPPVEVDKIWTITKTETTLTITCNNVELEVLNYSVAGSNCVLHWGGDVVEEIRFDETFDIASDYYRAGDVLNIVYTTKYYSPLKMTTNLSKHLKLTQPHTMCIVEIGCISRFLFSFC
eukprot:sb/3470348/